MKYAVDPLNLLSPGSLVESSPICRTSTPPRPRDRAEAIVLADAFFVVSSLPPPTSPAGLPLPCLSLCAAIRKCQFLSPTTAPVVAQGKELLGLCLYRDRTVLGLKEEELEPYIKLAPGVGYYRHTDLGGSPPRHHLFLDPDCALRLRVLEG